MSGYSLDRVSFPFMPAPRGAPAEPSLSSIDDELSIHGRAYPSAAPPIEPPLRFSPRNAGPAPIPLLVRSESHPGPTRNASPAPQTPRPGIRRAMSLRDSTANLVPLYLQPRPPTPPTPAPQTRLERIWRDDRLQRWAIGLGGIALGAALVAIGIAAHRGLVRAANPAEQISGAISSGADSAATNGSNSALVAAILAAIVVAI